MSKVELYVYEKGCGVKNSQTAIWVELVVPIIER